MSHDELERLAEDPRPHAGRTIEGLPDADPEGRHRRRTNHVDFFFYADGAGHDGRSVQIGAPDASA